MQGRAIEGWRNEMAEGLMQELDDTNMGVSRADARLIEHVLRGMLVSVRH